MKVVKIPRHRVVESIHGAGIIPVFYNDNIDVAKKVIKACFDGGARILEFTNRGDRAIAIFSELKEWCESQLTDCLLGIGTVFDSTTAVSYINCGADYIVGPTFNPKVAISCNRRKVLYIPGCQTLTEISNAEALGADIIKLFPASILTPSYVKSILGPKPCTLIMPSGGLKMEEKEIRDWIISGAVVLNMGSNLIRKDLVEKGCFDEISSNVNMCLEWVRNAKLRSS